MISTCKLSSRIKIEVKKKGKRINTQIGGASIGVRELLSNSAGTQNNELLQFASANLTTNIDYALSLRGLGKEKVGTIWVRLDMKRLNVPSQSEARMEIDSLSVELGGLMGGKEENLEVASTVDVANEISSQPNPMEVMDILSSRLQKLKQENLAPVTGMMDEVVKVSI